MKFTETITNTQIRRAAKKFTSRHAFEKGDKRHYAAAQRRGMLDEVCAHMTKRKRWTRAELEAEALKYKTRNAFKTGSYRAYMAAQYHGCLQDICAHMPLFAPPDVSQ